MLKECDDKLTRITNHLNDIRVVMTVNTKSLDEHMKRTALLESEVKLVEARSYNLSKQLYILIGVLAVLQPIILFLLSK